MAFNGSEALPLDLADTRAPAWALLEHELQWRTCLQVRSYERPASCYLNVAPNWCRRTHAPWRGCCQSMSYSGAPACMCQRHSCGSELMITGFQVVQADFTSTWSGHTILKSAQLDPEKPLCKAASPKPGFACFCLMLRRRRTHASWCGTSPHGPCPQEESHSWSKCT